MKNISKKELVKLLEKAGLDRSLKIDRDGDSWLTFGGDAELPYDMEVLLVCSDSGLMVVQCVCGELNKKGLDPANMVALCNEWNSEHRVPKVYCDVKKRTVAAEHNAFLDEEVSEEFVINNCIKLPIAGSIEFYKFLVGKQ